MIQIEKVDTAGCPPELLYRADHYSGFSALDPYHSTVNTSFLGPSREKEISVANFPGVPVGQQWNGFIAPLQNGRARTVLKEEPDLGQQCACLCRSVLS
jgi:hypothetical protein